MSWASGASADHAAIYAIAYNGATLYRSTDFGVTFSPFEVIEALSGASYAGSKQHFGIFVSRDGGVVAIGGADGVYLTSLPRGAQARLALVVEHLKEVTV